MSDTPRTDDLLTRLHECVGRYGVQCSETKELAPSNELINVLAEIKAELAAAPSADTVVVPVTKLVDWAYIVSWAHQEAIKHGYELPQLKSMEKAMLTAAKGEVMSKDPLVIRTEADHLHDRIWAWTIGFAIVATTATVLAVVALVVFL